VYKAEQIGEKFYNITTDFDGNEINFNVIVANDESELDGLVEHHLNFLKNPNPVVNTQEQEQQKSLSEVVQEQQAQIEELMNRLKQLESN
jgi:hypothetical protein